MSMEEVKLIEALIKDAKANESEIIRMYGNIASKLGESVPSNVVPFLNQSAVQLLSPQVVDILKKHRINAHSYLLVANNLLDLEDVKDDLLYGDVLTNAIPANTIRRLKVALAVANTPLATAPAEQQQPHPTVTKVTAPSIQPQSSQQSGASATDAGNDNFRLPIEIKKECTEMKNVDGMLCYKLKLTEISTFAGAASIIKRFAFNAPAAAQQANRKEWKTILLMGATGSGKTTMINAMINYVLGVEWEDPFRFMLVNEDLRGGGQAHSQTTGVTAYDIHYRKGFRIPFSLTIVDTPGFGDTEGIDRDKEITSAVKQFFEHQNGIQELDAVGFVVQSALARLTSAQTYIFNSVLSIFGKDIKENVRFLVTFSDGSPPLVLGAIQEANLPCQMNSNKLPCHQSFNNAAIYISEALAKDNLLLRFQWDSGMKNFKTFFDELDKMPTKSLQMTKEVLQIRKCLEIHLDFMQRGIQQQLMKMEELKETEKIIALNKSHIDANKNFEMKVPISKKAKVKCINNQNAMNCVKCEVTCHFPCEPSYITRVCPAFWQTARFKSSDSNDVPVTSVIKLYAASVQTIASTAFNLVVRENALTCRVCPGSCPTSDHTNEDTNWQYVQEDEVRTLYDIRKKYEDAMGQQLSAEGLKNALQAELEQLKFEMCMTIEEITECSNLLQQKALHGDPLTTPEYIRMMIENEKNEKKPGYNERIKSLQQVLKKAELTKDVLNKGEITKQYSL